MTETRKKAILITERERILGRRVKSPHKSVTVKSDTGARTEDRKALRQPGLTVENREPLSEDSGFISADDRMRRCPGQSVLR